MVPVAAWTIRGLFSATLIAGFGSAPAQATAACTPAMYQRADDALTKSDGRWESLLAHQRKFAACDDGALAEGYSEIVARNLARRWSMFPSFVAISKRHPDFRRWAIGHLDSSASEDDLKAIVRNSRKCGANSRSLCAAIREAADDALSEQKRLVGAKAPDCSGPDHWAAGMAFTMLKDDGLVTSDNVDFDHVTSVTIASEQIGKDLWRQVFRVTFPLTPKGRVEAIVVSDASSEECSMSDAQVFVISKTL